MAGLDVIKNHLLCGRILAALKWLGDATSYKRDSRLAVFANMVVILKVCRHVFVQLCKTSYLFVVLYYASYVCSVQVTVLELSRGSMYVVNVVIGMRP